MTGFKKDFTERVNPELMTRLLAEGVPTIKDIEFKFLEVKRGYCKALLPLNTASSNQHGTHQALLLGMGGDYTGGLALASIIDAEPILGIHEVTPEKGMSLWLIKSDMKYVKPSVDDVTIEATISEDQHAQLNTRYLAGSTILLDVKLFFRNTMEEDVAIGTFRYYCKKKNKLTPSKVNGTPNAMFEHILKTSAKMVSQLRALESSKYQPLFKDDLAIKVAGKQGKIIADRFLKVIPELQKLVSARTLHLDKTIESLVSQIDQIVFVGVGLDFRLSRQKVDLKSKNIYELDLPEMLKERQGQIERWNITMDKVGSTKQIGCDFLKDNIAQKLLDHGYNPKKATLFIYEGCSMYFQKEENTKILSEISVLLSQSEKSVLWMDAIDPLVILDENKSQGVKEFISGMAKMGEPFVFGFHREDPLFRKVNLSTVKVENVSEFLPDCKGEIYALYYFNLLQYKG